MNSTKLFFSVMALSTMFLFACRGGVNKNNDHDYDGKNENNDGTNTQQTPSDTGTSDTNSRYPLDENSFKDSTRNPQK